MNRRAVLLLLYLCLIGGGLVLGLWLPGALHLEPGSETPSGMPLMLAVVTVVFVLASAAPFVPGAEIGIALMAAFGDTVAALVYAGMVAALSLSFLAGRVIPPERLARAFAALGLARAAALVRQSKGMSPDERRDHLARHAPNRLVPFLLRHRYVALAVALNFPGSALLGGGGGIALVAGMSRLFTPAGFLLSVAVAAAPLPLLVLLTGYAPLP
ncbi:hypothetical protein [Tranquillimonas alkanivorans]|uniref:TVP38/TMEM64 family membrane protein n=1 Tax=Tranquillimonas alkanivorans TaxID=441119 RepID=A0A1I5KV87_9RHOB|nr:hypothetical protein [Tranquillimonas alkanivorans]SFO88917.1 hypothetical protein SAMN04488047_101324 [Tranquillimonas alkanivorans]